MVHVCCQVRLTHFLVLTPFRKAIWSGLALPSHLLHRPAFPRLSFLGQEFFSVCITVATLLSLSCFPPFSYPQVFCSGFTFLASLPLALKLLLLSFCSHSFYPPTPILLVTVFFFFPLLSRVGWDWVSMFFCFCLVVNLSLAFQMYLYLSWCVWVRVSPWTPWGLRLQDLPLWIPCSIQ